MYFKGAIQGDLLANAPLKETVSWYNVSLVILLLLLGLDKDIEECQRFYREGLTTSFIRILTDDAVKTWKPDIQVC